MLLLLIIFYLMQAIECLSQEVHTTKVPRGWPQQGRSDLSRSLRCKVPWGPRQDREETDLNVHARRADDETNAATAKIELIIILLMIVCDCKIMCVIRYSIIILIIWVHMVSIVTCTVLGTIGRSIGLCGSSGFMHAPSFIHCLILSLLINMSTNWQWLLLAAGIESYNPHQEPTWLAHTSTCVCVCVYILWLSDCANV